MRSVLRVPLLCLSVAALRCTASLREVMLVISTDIPCEQMDRIEVKLARGSSSGLAFTYSQIFGRVGCMTSGSTGLPRVPLGEAQSFRLGVVDARRNDDRLRAEVFGRRDEGVIVRAVAETTFVDDRVGELVLELLSVCAGTQLRCDAQQTCRPSPDDETVGICVDAYTPPTRLRRVASAITLQAMAEP